jgi:hypothetical protein
MTQMHTNCTGLLLGAKAMTITPEAVEAAALAIADYWAQEGIKGCEGPAKAALTAALPHLRRPALSQSDLGLARYIADGFAGGGGYADIESKARNVIAAIRADEREAGATFLEAEAQREGNDNRACTLRIAAAAIRERL